MEGAMNESNRDLDKQPALGNRQLPVREHSDYANIANRLRRYQDKRLPVGWEDELYEQYRDKKRGIE